MLEKNKDYVEFTLQSTTVERTRDKDYRQVCLNGYSDYDFPGVPMDVVCKEFDHKVVIISKRDFDRLQAKAKDAETYSKCIDYMEEACQSYRDTIEDLKKKLADYETISSAKHEVIQSWKEVTGFSSCEEIEDYLVNEAECDTLHEAIDSLEYSVKFARDERRDLSKKLDECEKDYISERDKAEALQTENEQLKKKLAEFENEPTHIVYLNDPLGVIAKWEKVTGYNDPKDFLKWKANIEAIMEAWKDATGCKYPGDARKLLEKWQTMTRSETPENAAKWLERFEETDKRCDKLAREVESWKDAIGYSTLEDYLQARINFATPFDYTAAWQKSTGCIDPEAAKQYIDRLKGRLNKIHDCSVDW